MAHLCCSYSSLMTPGKPGQFNLRWVAFLSCIFSIFALPSIAFSLCVRARSVWKIVTFIDSLDCKYFRRASSAWNPQSVVRGGKWLEILKISSFLFFPASFPPWKCSAYIEGSCQSNLSCQEVGTGLGLAYENTQGHVMQKMWVQVRKYCKSGVLKTDVEPGKMLFSFVRPRAQKTKSRNSWCHLCCHLSWACLRRKPVGRKTVQKAGVRVGKTTKETGKLITLILAIDYYNKLLTISVLTTKYKHFTFMWANEWFSSVRAIMGILSCVAKKKNQPLCCQACWWLIRKSGDYGGRSVYSPSTPAYLWSLISGRRPPTVPPN